MKCFVRNDEIKLWNQSKIKSMMHKACSSIEEVPYCFSRSSVKFQGHTALKIVEFDPNWAFPDSNSSLNSPMAMKCCTKLETAKEICPIVFQGHPSNFKVTRDKTSPILTQIGRFRTIGRSQLSNPSDLPCFRGMRIFVTKIKRSRDRLIFIMGILILVRRRLYIKTGHLEANHSPRLPKLHCPYEATVQNRGINFYSIMMTIIVILMTMTCKHYRGKCSKCPYATLVTAWFYVHCSPLCLGVRWPDCFSSSSFSLLTRAATIVMSQQGMSH